MMQSSALPAAVQDAESSHLLSLLGDETRDRARSGLLNFICYNKPNFEVNWHHVVACRLLNAFARGVLKRIIITWPPRHGKSEIVSRHLPAFCLGLNPDDEIIAASYGAKLARAMNRDVQRIISGPRFDELFPATRIMAYKARSKTNSRWMRNADLFEIIDRRGKYQCSGIGGPLTGQGGDKVIIDDPVKNWQDAMSKLYRDRCWDWYNSTLYTRLSKDAGICIVLCMTGDTRVMMADGSETPLRFVKPGDKIATYHDGRVVVSTVRDWKHQGLDNVFRVRTSSGITLKANERHPFLVSRNGGLEWVRLKDLRLNDKMIRVTGRGAVLSAAWKDAASRCDASTCVCITTPKSDGRTGIGHPRATQAADGPPSYEIATASRSTSTSKQWTNRAANAPYAEIPRGPASTSRQPGTKSFASTMITTPDGCEGCCATNAISSSNTRARSKSYSTPSITCDPIVEITPAGVESVYDIQVEGTGNFIANGVVSHNTRWHEDDLAGRLIEQMEKDPEADKWVVLNLEAIKESPQTQWDKREVGEALWPQRFPVPRLNKIKSNSLLVWNSLYQGRPSSPEGNVIKDDWWRYWTKATLPPQMDWWRISADLTFKDKQKNDWTVMQVWGGKGANRYLVDQSREKAAFVRQCQMLVTLLKLHPYVTGIFVEDAANAASLIDMLRDLVPGLVPIPATDSKLARAESVSPLIQAGNVWLPQDAPWTKGFVQECHDFPKGKNDDQVDAMTQLLSEMHDGGNVPDDILIPMRTKRSKWKGRIGE